MKKSIESNEFNAEKFIQNCMDKTQLMMNEELEIDIPSLLKWFIEVAPVRKFAPDVIRNFEKIFALLLWWDFLKDNDCFMSIASHEEMKKIKEFAKQFEPKKKGE